MSTVACSDHSAHASWYLLQMTKMHHFHVLAVPLKPDGRPALIYPNYIFAQPQYIRKTAGLEPVGYAERQASSMDETTSELVSYTMAAGYCLMW